MVTRGRPVMVCVGSLATREPSLMAAAAAGDDPGWDPDEEVGWDFHDDWLEGDPSSDDDPPTSPIQLQLLRHYLTHISSPSCQTQLQAKLQHHSNETAAIHLYNYYATRPGLQEYTLGVELDRMEYTLITHDGKHIHDKQEIRNYCSSSTLMEEDILVRSANQSLLADVLLLLTGSEEDLLTTTTPIPMLMTSGPLLTMTTLAQRCIFVIDYRNGFVEATCHLDIHVPFHGDGMVLRDDVPNHPEILHEDKVTVARAIVLVRFRPGTENSSPPPPPTIQYVVSSVEPTLTVESPLVRFVALSLATMDSHQDDEPTIPETTTDVRDLFLLHHQLLSDSNLLAVSDHFVRLRGAAEASSTGFRSAMRQLDGVTGVSGKWERMKTVGGFWSGDDVEWEVDMPASRPPPLIGGMVLSGLSRLAAVATQPKDLAKRSDDDNRRCVMPSIHDTRTDVLPVEEEVTDDVDELDGGWSDDGLDLDDEDPSQEMADLPTKDALPNAPEPMHAVTKVSTPLMVEHNETKHNVDDLNGGWSDDGLDLDDEDPSQDMADLPTKDALPNAPEPMHAVTKVSTPLMVEHNETKHKVMFPEKQPIVPPTKQPTTNATTFEEEFVIVLNEKIEEEEKEMSETGRMKRWTPLSEDPIRRKRLMEVMMNQLDQSP